MELKLNKSQYAELLEAVLINSWVKGLMYDQGLHDNKKYDEIENYLLENAKFFGCEKLAELFHGHIVPSDKFSQKVDTLMEEYNQDNFWHELEMRLGQREFARTVTKEEIEEMNNNGNWYPKRIQEIYAKYEKEFEENGLARFDIVERNKNKS